MVIIYKIESPSGKVYIGQTWNYKKRVSTYKNVSCKNQPKLYNSFLKYGVDNHSFMIVHELPEDINQDIIDAYEQLYIDQYRDCSIELMNIREAGSRGKHSLESVEKMRQGNIGKIIPLEVREKMSKRMKGNKIRLGKSMSEETKLKMSISRKGKVRSEETRLKMSLAAKGKKKSPEHVKKVTESRMRNRQLKLEINLEN